MEIKIRVVKQGGTQMKRMIKVAKAIGKVFLAIITGILMPILIWVALGAALNQKARQKAAEQAKAPTIREILDKAEVKIK